VHDSKNYEFYNNLNDIIENTVNKVKEKFDENCLFAIQKYNERPLMFKKRILKIRLYAIITN